MGIFLEPSDLANFADIPDGKANDMIEDAEAMAVLTAPCLDDDFNPPLSSTKRAAAKAILRGAILRWNEAGTGALAGQTAGPFGQTLDTRQERRNMFWPSEITQLQTLCATAEGSIYTTSLAGPDPSPADDYWFGVA